MNPAPASISKKPLADILPEVLFISLFDTVSRKDIIKLENKNMLDDKDIQKLIQVFATRDEIKEMVSDLVTKDDFSNLQTSVDAYAKKLEY